MTAMEPGRKPLGGSEQIHIACYQAGVDVVVRHLNFRVLQPRVPESARVGKSVNVGDVDQLNGRLRFDTLLTGSESTAPQILRDDWGQPAMDSIVQIHARLDGDVEVDLLRIAGRSGGSTRGPEWTHFTIHSACGP